MFSSFSSQPQSLKEKKTFFKMTASIKHFNNGVGVLTICCGEYNGMDLTFVNKEQSFLVGQFVDFTLVDATSYLCATHKYEAIDVCNPRWKIGFCHV